MISQKIREARKDAKLTQNQLAVKVGTTKATISNYENRYSTPSNEMLVKLSETLNVSTDYLLDVESNQIRNKTKIKMNTIGDRIKARRKELGLTQTELAKKINGSSQVVSNWERGYSKPSSDDIANLAEALEVSVDFLFNSKNKDSEVEKLKTKIKRYEDYLQESLEHWNSLGDKPVRAEVIAAGIADFLDDESSQ